MTGNLGHRLEQIPGIASVTIDLTDTGGGINVRLDPDADEAAVMEELRTILVAYGIRSADPKVSLGRPPRAAEPMTEFDVDVAITPLRSGARVEVFGKNVRSFRVVPASSSAIAQGLADAWCQVKGRVPVEIISVSVGDSGDLTIVASGDRGRSVGTANVSIGWEQALTQAVGDALWSEKRVEPGDRPLASNSH
jgi:hypothetical protein